MKNFLGVYYEWGCDAKVAYDKMTIEKDVNKLVELYENYTGSDFKVQKTPGDTGTTLSYSDLEKPYDMDNYR